MIKVYMEIICDQDVADELFSYPPERVDVIRYDENPDVVIEMGGEKYRTAKEDE
jgi:hypothetical protein